MALPQGLNLSQTQNTWASAINPVISFPPVQGILLKDIKLVPGANVINHLLGRIPQGYIIIDQDAATSVYRSQALNKLTLTLTSTNAATVAMWIF